MKNILATTALLLGVFFAVGTAAQEIDTDRSVVEFEVGNLWINTVEGTFSGMSGTASFNAQQPDKARFDVCVDAASVNTGNQKRDEHLRSDDFFDVANHPKICIEISNVSPAADGYLAEGTLDMHGVAKNITIPFTATDGHLQGTFTIDRFDYEVGKDTGTFTVDDEVTVTIHCYLE